MPLSNKLTSKKHELEKSKADLQPQTKPFWQV